MSLPAMKPDRRRSPRKNLEGLAYVNFEPENGGIILNVSEDGLCFCAVAPVPDDGPVSFSFLTNGNRIDAQGSLVWTDRARKTGGLRFTEVPAEAREQISHWMLPASRPAAVDRLILAARQPELTAESVPKPVLIRPRATLEALSRWGRAPLRWTEFSRGLAVGLLIALFVAGAFMFQARRQQLGRMLIRLGERFESTPQPTAPSTARSLPAATESATSKAATTKVVAPAKPATSRNAGAPPASSAANHASATSEKLPLLRSAKAIPHPSSTAASLASKKSAAAESLKSANSTPPLSAAAASQPSGAASSTTSQPAAPQPTSGQPTAAGSSPGHSNSVTAKAADSSTDDTEDVLEINSGVPFGKYLTVGKFKDPLAASQTQRQLTNLGFRAALVPKSLLWMKSYEVLVGPYHDAASADDARHNLQSHGFKPHSLAKRSRRLTLVATWSNAYGSNQDGTEDFVVSWEAYSSDATVKLVSRGGTTASAVGTWVKLPARSEYTSITYTPTGNGKRNLLAIQFRGMSQAVSLPDSSAHGIVF
jgi:PilZ domain/SPOR domain